MSDLTGPVFDRHVAQIACPVQDHKHEEPIAPRAVDIAGIVAEAGHQRAHECGLARRHEGARPQKVIVARARHHVTEIEETGNPPASVTLAQQKVFRDIFSRQDDGRLLGRHERRGSGDDVAKIIEMFG